MKTLGLLLLFLALGVAGGSIYKLSQPAAPQSLIKVTEGDYRPYFLGSTATVIVYSLSTCRYCESTLALLDEWNIAYEERVVDHSPSAQADVAQIGANQAPLILTARYSIEGFDQQAIAETLRSQGLL